MENSNKTILITGGAGYIGNCLIEELIIKGYKPKIFDIFNWGKDSLKRFGNNIEIIEGDCRNSKHVIYALQGVDKVIHLAGIVGEPACKKNIYAHYSVNVEATRTLVNLCVNEKLGIINDFIFASSCSVYGNVKGIYDEVFEDTPPKPLSLYAEGKLQSEEIIMDAAKTHPDFHPTILRLTTLFGWSPKPRIDLVTNMFTYKGWKDKNLAIYGDGKQYRSLIHVRDVAKAFISVLESDISVRSRKIYHVGEEKNNIMIKDIARKVKQLSEDIIIEVKAGEETDKRDYKINCGKIKNEIGWSAKYTVEEGVKEMYEKYQNESLDWDSGKYRNNTFDYE